MKLPESMRYPPYIPDQSNMLLEGEFNIEFPESSRYPQRIQS